MDLTQQIMHGMNILKMFNIIDDISNHENWSHFSNRPGKI